MKVRTVRDVSLMNHKTGVETHRPAGSEAIFVAFTAEITPAFELIARAGVIFLDDNPNFEAAGVLLGEIEPVLDNEDKRTIVLNAIESMIGTARAAKLSEGGANDLAALQAIYTSIQQAPSLAEIEKLMRAAGPVKAKAHE